MRAFLLYMILFWLAPFVALAQFAGIGLGAGGNGSKFINTHQSLVSNPNEQADQGNKLGGNGGIKLEWYLFNQDWLKLSPEIYLQQKGSKEYYPDIQSLTTGLTDRSITLDYGGILLPVKLDIPGNFGGSETTLLYGQFNFYSDYSFSARSSNGNWVDFERNTDKIDMGYSAFIGVALAPGAFLQFGYQRGLKNIKFFTENADNNQRNSAYLVNNRNFSLSIVYIYTNNKR